MYIETILFDSQLFICFRLQQNPAKYVLNDENFSRKFENAYVPVFYSSIKFNI